MSHILYEGNRGLVFSPGSHVLVIRYCGMWDIDDSLLNYISDSYPAKYTSNMRGLQLNFARPALFQEVGFNK